MSSSHSSEGSVRQEIIALIEQTRKLIPSDPLDPMPADESLRGAAGWRDFEYRIWELGERIRQLFLKAPHLRRDEALQEHIADVALDRRAHRGRQSFILLLGYRVYTKHAASLARHLDDPFVEGHVIGTLYKMRATGYTKDARPFLAHETAWIRNEAKRYLAWDLQ